MGKKPADESEKSEEVHAETKAAKWITPAQFAKRRGVSRIAVVQALARGRLTEASAKFVDKRWRIDPELADAEWERNTRRRRGVNSTAEEESASEAVATEALLPRSVEDFGPALRFGPGDIPVDEDGRPIPPVLVSAIKTGLEARIKQLELEERKRQLVSVSEAARSWAHVAQTLRDGILSVPSRMAKELAAEDDPVQVEILLEAELIRALNALAEGELER